MGGSMCRDASSRPIAVGVVVAVRKVGWGTSSKIDGGALSHLTQKCLRRVTHEFMISGVEILSSSYHLSAMLPTPRWQASDSHFPSSV